MVCLLWISSPTKHLSIHPFEYRQRLLWNSFRIAIFVPHCFGWFGRLTDVTLYGDSSSPLPVAPHTTPFYEQAGIWCVYSRVSTFWSIVAIYFPPPPSLLVSAATAVAVVVCQSKSIHFTNQCPLILSAAQSTV